MKANNLPQFTTPLIGREVEMADIGARLGDPHCRLLTLVGPGGIGKTRLAIEAASDQAQVFQDGVFFVALQPVASVENIVRTVGGAIGYEFSAGSEQKMQLHQHLREKNQLLILDNLEHLQGVDSIITDLLNETSRLKLLVTSREPLHLQNEWLYHVEGLPFPELESANEIESFDAVQMFANHAHRVRRNFSLQEEQEAVIRICRLVVGMPLGIELAASWRRLLPSAEIARELENSLDILQADLRDVPDRHRSMRAVFDHSWKLLSDAEQRTFMALSVFRGGCRREAAEEIAGATLPVLMSLVDKSMLKVSRSGRYEIHELQRQYAAERLKELPELESAVLDRHSDYYTRFINRPVNDFLRVGNQQTLSDIDVEIDNIRSAWERAIGFRQVNNISQAMQGLYWYAWMRSWHEEGERAFREAVAVLRQTEPTDENQITLGRALCLQAAMDIWLGHAAQAGVRAEEGVMIFSRLEVRRNLAEAIHIKGWAALAQRDWLGAKGLLEEAVALYDEVDRSDQNEVKGFAFGQLGHIARAEGDYETGVHWYQRALTLGREIKDQRAIADAFGSLGHLALWQGDYVLARQHCEESLAVARTAEMAPMIIGALHGLGGIARATGRLEEARDHIEESLQVAKEDGKEPSIAGSLICLAEVMVDRGDCKVAEELYKQALEISPGATDRWRYAAVRTGRGRIAWQTGDYGTARRHHEASLVLYREMHDRPGIINNLVSLARIALAEGDMRLSADNFATSLKIAIEEGAPPLLLHVFVGIAELFNKQSNLRDAVRLAVLVSQHPASSAKSKNLAETMLNTPEASLMAARAGTVADRDKYTDLNRLGEQLVKQLSIPPVEPLIEGLSTRELEVLQMVAAGKSNREIAQDLVLAVGTVKTHLHNILQKLDASSRTQAVARARDLHLL